MSTVKVSQDELAHGLSISSVDMSSSGWIEVGTADVTIKLKSRDAMIVDTVAALRTQQAAINAHAGREAARIEGEIQTLLAIAYEIEA